MQNYVLVKAVVPKELKCLAFSALARRDEKFTRWLHRQMEALVVQTRENEETLKRMPAEGGAHDELVHP